MNPAIPAPRPRYPLTTPRQPPPLSPGSLSPVTPATPTPTNRYLTTPRQPPPLSPGSLSPVTPTTCQALHWGTAVVAGLTEPGNPRHPHARQPG